MIAEKSIPIVDLSDCHDVFVTGCARIDRLPGNCFRIVGYVDYFDEGDQARLVVTKEVWPKEKLLEFLIVAQRMLAADEGLAQDGTCGRPIGASAH